MPRPISCFVLGVSAATAALTACTAPLPAGTAQRRAELAELRHPADVDFAGNLDISVARDGDDLHLINREARAFDGAIVWLNQQYAGLATRLAIGPDNRMPLRAFANRHGETFPAGSWLAPDAAETLVAAELVLADGSRHRLTVWPDERWYE